MQLRCSLFSLEHNKSMRLGEALACVAVRKKVGYKESLYRYSEYSLVLIVSLSLSLYLSLSVYDYVTGIAFIKKFSLNNNWKHLNFALFLQKF